MTLEQAENLQREMQPSLYAALVAAGCEIDSHESDLYVRHTPESLAILQRHNATFECFVSQIDGRVWFDVPFMYEPFWQAVTHGR